MRTIVIPNEDLNLIFETDERDVEISASIVRRLINNLIDRSIENDLAFTHEKQTDDNQPTINPEV